MKLVSVNVGRPRLLVWKGSTISTGIFKKPVSGRVMLRMTNLDGDRQADLSVHGGPGRAAYGYPSEHYEYWRAELPGRELTWGEFGENFTTQGLLETEVSIGDRYRVGSAVVMVRAPRIPCYKLAAKFGRDDMVERFLHSGFCGFYFSVEQEGEVGAHDTIEFLEAASPSITVAEVNRLYISGSADLESLARAVQAQFLPEKWRERFQNRIAALENQIPI